MRLYLLLVSLALATRLAAQARAVDLIAAARAQLAAGRADSGLALLDAALDSGARATTPQRVSALVWRGVLRYYKGSDSLARESFREALMIDPRLEVAGLAQIDSALALEFEAVRRTIELPPTAARPSAALGRLAAGARTDAIFSCVPECHGLDQPPRALDGAAGPVVVRGTSQPMLGGVAVVRFVVDSAGVVEPGSITVVSSPNPAFHDQLVDHVRPARFAPGRAQGRAVRVLMQWRLSLRGP